MLRRSADPRDGLIVESEDDDCGPPVSPCDLSNMGGSPTLFDVESRHVLTDESHDSGSYDVRQPHTISKNTCPCCISFHLFVYSSCRCSTEGTWNQGVRPCTRQGQRPHVEKQLTDYHSYDQRRPPIHKPGTINHGDLGQPTSFFCCTACSLGAHMHAHSHLSCS